MVLIGSPTISNRGGVKIPLELDYGGHCPNPSNAPPGIDGISVRDHHPGFGALLPSSHGGSQGFKSLPAYHVQ